MFWVPCKTYEFLFRAFLCADNLVLMDVDRGKDDTSRVCARVCEVGMGSRK